MSERFLSIRAYFSQRRYTNTIFLSFSFPS